MDQKYGGIIWTNHALERLKERGIKQGDAWTTWKRPDQSRFAKTKNAWVYYKTWGSRRVEVVAKQNERKEWVVMTVWDKNIEEFPPKPSLIRWLIKKIFKI
jgi:hypothetical protein